MRGPRSLDRFVVANATVLIITTAIFALWPVTTAWVHLNTSPDVLSKLDLVVHSGWPEQLLRLRKGDAFEVTTANNFAIIGFPSYHTAAAALIVWTLWPMRYLRLPALMWNCLLIAATPYDGGHYFVDLLCSLPVVMAGVWVAYRCIPSTKSDVPGAWRWTVDQISGATRWAHKQHRLDVLNGLYRLRRPRQRSIKLGSS